MSCVVYPSPFTLHVMGVTAFLTLQHKVTLYVSLCGWREDDLYRHRTIRARPRPESGDTATD